MLRSQLLSALLFGISPDDLTTYEIVFVALMAVSVLAFVVARAPRGYHRSGDRHASGVTRVLGLLGAAGRQPQFYWAGRDRPLLGTNSLARQAAVTWKILGLSWHPPRVRSLTVPTGANLVLAPIKLHQRSQDGADQPPGADGCPTIFGTGS